MTTIPAGTKLLSEEEAQFVKSFNQISTRVHESAKAKGWWEVERNNGELIALIHSELSEALEALRNKIEISDHIPLFFGVEEELADVIIRIMDMAVARNYHLPLAIIAKIGFNDNRPHKHGGKAF